MESTGLERTTFCRRLSAVVGAIAVVAAASTAAGAEHFDSALSTITQADLTNHLAFLASDALEGREAGTPGGRAASAYVIDRLKAFGVEPAGEEDGYLQEFGNGYRNALGVIRGGDPQWRDEYILVGSHLDHVGYGTRLNSRGGVGLIHNGADDNASGVAGVLELAQALASLPSPLARSVLVGFWDGEEKGLLGSNHWVSHPTVPLNKVRLAINLDMIGRMRNESITVYGFRTSCGLRECVTRANERARLRIRFDASHRDDSDHHTFFGKDIPYLMLFTGEHDDYHRPSDDVDRINFAGLEQVTRTVLSVIAECGESSTLGQFRRECRNEAGSQGPPMLPCPPRLGIHWNEERRPGEPFPLELVDPESPAAMAGLRAGDVVTSAGGQPAANIESLRDLVGGWRGPFPVTVQRVGEDEVHVDVELLGQPVPPGVRVRRDLADVDTLLASRVVTDSAAGRAGLRGGDRIFTAVADSQAVPAGLQSAWTIERDGRLERVAVDWTPFGN